MYNWIVMTLTIQEPYLYFGLSAEQWDKVSINTVSDSLFKSIYLQCNK